MELDQSQNQQQIWNDGRIPISGGKNGNGSSRENLEFPLLSNKNGNEGAQCFPWNDSNDMRHGIYVNWNGSGHQIASVQFQMTAFVQLCILWTLLIPFQICYHYVKNDISVLRHFSVQR